MGWASSVSHLPAMRTYAMSTWEVDHNRQHWYNSQQMQHWSIYAPPTFTCNTRFGPSALMAATVIARVLRGKGNCIIKGCIKEFSMLLQAWFEVLLLPLVLWRWKSGLNSQATSSPPDSWTNPGLCFYVGFMSVLLNPQPSTDYHPLLAYHSLCRSNFNLALYSPAIMVWPRQRMLSRHGSSRGGSSHPSEAEDTSHHFHCHCLCPYAAGASSLRPSQFLQASSPGSSTSPSFDSAVFTFNTTLNRPIINAHVSVLFIEEAQEEGKSSAQREDSPPAETRRAMETPSADPMKDSEGPSSQKVEAGKEPIMAAAEEVPEQEMEEYGWCRIVEEVPED